MLFLSMKFCQLKQAQQMTNALTVSKTWKEHSKWVGEMDLQIGDQSLYFHMCSRENVELNTSTTMTIMDHNGP